MKPKSLLLLLILVGAPGCQKEPKTYTGAVTTTMCNGTSHIAGLTAADCVHKCIREGSGYALVVDTTIYKLDGNVSGLDAFAGSEASVFGTARGHTIHVRSVSGTANK